MPSSLKLRLTFLIIFLLTAGCAPAAVEYYAPEIALPPELASDRPAQQELVWFEVLPERSAQSAAEQERIAAWIFGYLFQTSGSSQFSSSLENDAPAMLFLSLSDGASRAEVLRASGLTMRAAVEALVSQIDAHLLAREKPLWAKLDFVDEVLTFKSTNLTSAQKEQPSLYGLAFQRSSGFALLPEVLVAEALFNSDQIFQLSNLANYLEEKNQPLDLLSELGSAENVLAYRFTTHGFFYEDGHVIPLFRGHRMVPSPAPEELLASAVSGGNYLINAVKADGRFVYSYQPVTDKESDTYNILRHAGTVYAMADLYQQTGDPRLLAAVERAVEYLHRQIQECQVNGVVENCIVEQGETKLGGNGLAVLAFTQYMKATGRMDLLDDTRSLARWIVSTQNASGEFMIHKVDLPSGEITDFVSDYYPGEAIYALARLYTLDKDDRWLKAASRGAKWLAKDRIEGKAEAEITHDHWLLLGLGELQHIAPDPVYIESAMRIADAIIASQNLDPEFPDWFGSYYRPPGSTPAATRSEGLMAAYRIMRDFGASDQAGRILQAVKDNVTFQLNTQFHSESAMYLPDPQRVLGGFHQSLTNFEIRNDYVQHNLSSILALYRCLTIPDG